MKLSAKVSMYIDVSELYQESKEIGLSWDYYECLKFVKRKFDEIIKRNTIELYGPSPGISNADCGKELLNTVKVQEKIIQKMKLKKKMRDKWRNPKRRIK